MESDLSREVKWSRNYSLLIALSMFTLIGIWSTVNASTRVLVVDEASAINVKDLERRINSTACKAAGLQFVYSKQGYKGFYNLVELHLADGVLEIEIHGNVDRGLEDYIFRYLELSLSGFSEDFLIIYFGICSISDNLNDFFTGMENLGVLNEVTLSDGFKFKTLEDKEFSWLLGLGNEFKYAIPSELVADGINLIRFLEYMYIESDYESKSWEENFRKFVAEVYDDASISKSIIDKSKVSLKRPINFGYDSIKGDPFSRTVEE